MSLTTRLRVPALLGVIGLALAGCGGASSPSPDEEAPAGSGELARACGDSVDVQLPWWPTVDFAFLFELIGAGGVVNGDDNTYSGEIGETGVTLALRSGGPAAGYQPAQSLIYQDESIDLLVGAVDAQVNSSADLPTVSVFNYYDTYPVIFLWGNDAWDFQSLADIKASGETILASSFGSYITALTGSGDIDPDQVDSSYDGSPSRFVAAGGNLIQQDYITTAPYLFEHDTPAWNKPIEFISLNSAYPVYQATLQVRSDRLEEYSPCLEQLVPLVQQAAVDYAVDPGATNDVLVDYTSQLPGIGVPQTVELLDAGHAAQLKYGVVRDGSDGSIGSFDLEQVQSSIDLLVPAFEAEGIVMDPELSPETIVTNEFLDPEISLPDDLEVPPNDLPDDVPGLELDR